MSDLTFDGQTCACGATTFFWTRLTILEWLMFKLGVWRQPDTEKVQHIKAPLGGEINAHRAAMEKIADKESQHA